MNNDADNVNARLLVILIRHRQTGMISDGNKKIENKVFQMKILIFKVFLRKYNFKNDTMNESQLQTLYIYPIYPSYPKIFSDKGVVNTDL